MSKATELLINLAYQRVKTRFDEKNQQNNITLASIYPEDPRLIGRILRNERIPKKNSNLLTNHSANAIAESLDFKDDKEVYWGSDAEIDHYLLPLFLAACLDVLEDEKKGRVYFLLRQLLFDFVPYAKWFSLHEICTAHYDRMKKKTGYPSDELFHICNIDSVEELNLEISLSAERGIIRLSQLPSTNGEKVMLDVFKNTFCDFSSKSEDKSKTRNKKGKEVRKRYHGMNLGFRGLDNRWQIFIEHEFSNLLEQFLPSDSIGLRVRNIVLNDISLSVKSELELTWLSPDFSSRLLTKGSQNKYDVISALVSGAFDYIDVLEKYQQDREGDDYIDEMITKNKALLKSITPIIFLMQ